MSTTGLSTSLTDPIRNLQFSLAVKIKMYTGKTVNSIVTTTSEHNQLRYVHHLCSLTNNESSFVVDNT